MVSDLFYALEAKDGRGGTYHFNKLRDKVVIIVNVASLCGFTPQYKELQYLYNKYNSMGLEILAFPCNQFGGQEPGDQTSIQDFVKTKFDISFPVLAKVCVNGDDTHPVYTHLKLKKTGLFGFRGVQWNFEKFVIDRKGEVVGRFESGVTPLQLEPLISATLSANTD